MRIPVFVSCPTVLNARQQAARRLIDAELDRLGLESRTLGKSDYPVELPLREVLRLARHCSGGVVLGFEQFRARSGTWKRGTRAQQRSAAPVPLPTPWNQLEAGILFGLGLPLLVFKEAGVGGGVFDAGVTDAFVHPMPVAPLPRARRADLAQVLMRWQADVRRHYYGP